MALQPCRLIPIKPRRRHWCMVAPPHHREKRMSAAEIANRHFAAAMAEVKAAGESPDSLCRSLLGLIVSAYLETRSVADVQSELRFVADNCDPDTDFAFMRP
jgi:hypothetical protein